MSSQCSRLLDLPERRRRASLSNHRSWAAAPAPAVLPLRDVFALPGADAGAAPALECVADDLELLLVAVSLDPSASALALRARTRLPLAAPPALVLPVDPMAWAGAAGAAGRRGGSTSIG
jgi:hypothetical protein